MRNLERNPILSNSSRKSSTTETRKSRRDRRQKSPWHSTSLLLLSAMLAAACHEARSPTDPPDLDFLEQRVEVVSGNGQQGAPGESLAPLVVRVTDRSGHPVQGAMVFWSFLRGDGALEPGVSGNCDCDSVTSTNRMGLTESRLTLGIRPGINEIEARSVFSTNYIVFEATAIGGP